MTHVIFPAATFRTGSEGVAPADIKLVETLKRGSVRRLALALSGRVFALSLVAAVLGGAAVAYASDVKTPGLVIDLGRAGDTSGVRKPIDLKTVGLTIDLHNGATGDSGARHSHDVKTVGLTIDLHNGATDDSGARHSRDVKTVSLTIDLHNGATGDSGAKKPIAIRTSPLTISLNTRP